MRSTGKRCRDAGCRCFLASPNAGFKWTQAPRTEDERGDSSAGVWEIDQWPSPSIGSPAFQSWRRSRADVSGELGPRKTRPALSGRARSVGHGTLDRNSRPGKDVVDGRMAGGCCLSLMSQARRERIVDEARGGGLESEPPVVAGWRAGVSRTRGRCGQRAPAPCPRYRAPTPPITEPSSPCPAGISTATASRAILRSN